MSDKSFLEALEELINGYSIENGSNTPDFLLADYIAFCLNAYEQTVTARDKWYNFKPWPRGTTTAPSPNTEQVEKK